MAWPAGAGAHVGGSGFILLLPTHLYVLGGAIVVAASFLLVALAPTRLLARAESLRVRLGAASFPGRRALSTGVSLLSLAVVVALIVAGVRGRSRRSRIRSGPATGRPSPASRRSPGSS